MTKTKTTIRLFSKDSSPKKNQINILSRFPGFPKCHRQIFKRKAYSSTHGPTTTMFRASASNHRQHKHLTVDLITDTSSINMLSLSKAQSHELKMFLNDLKRGTSPPQKKSYELKPIIRIVHTTSMHKSQMTSFNIHLLPTNNSVDNNEPVVDNQYPFRNTNS